VLCYTHEIIKDPELRRKLKLTYILVVCGTILLVFNIVDYGNFVHVFRKM